MAGWFTSTTVVLAMAGAPHRLEGSKGLHGHARGKLSPNDSTLGFLDLDIGYDGFDLALDFRGLGIGNGKDAQFLAGFQRLVNNSQDFQDTLQVKRRFRDQQAIDPFNGMTLP